jgi:hypothetical protein
MAAQGWRDFRFSNPDTPFKRNFNWIANTMRVQIAFAYAFCSGANDSVNYQDTKHALDASYPGVANALIGEFQEPHPGSVVAKQLGLPDGWLPPRVAVNRDGASFLLVSNGHLPSVGNTRAGETYVFPEVDPQWVKPKQWWEQ